MTSLSDEDMRAWTEQTNERGVMRVDPDASSAEFEKQAKEMTDLLQKQMLLEEEAKQNKEQHDASVNSAMEAAKQLVVSQAALQKEEEKRKSANESLDAIVREMEKEGPPRRAQPEQQDRNRKEFDAVKEYMELKLKQDKIKDQRREAEESMNSIVDYLNGNKTTKEDALKFIDSLNTPTDKRTPEQQNFAEKIIKPVKPAATSREPMMSLDSLHKAIDEGLESARSAVSSLPQSAANADLLATLQQIKDDAAACQPTDHTRITNIMTSLIVAGMDAQHSLTAMKEKSDTEFETLTSTLRSTMGDVVPQPSSKPPTKRVPSTQAAKTAKRGTSGKALPGNKRAAQPRLTEELSCTVHVVEGTLDATILRVFSSVAGVRELDHYNVVLEEHSDASEPVMVFSYGEDSGEHTVSGILPICKTLCMLYSHAECTYPTTSPVLFSLVESCLNSVTRLVPLTRAMQRLETGITEGNFSVGLRKSSWLQKAGRAVTGSPAVSMDHELESLLHECQAVLRHINDTYYVPQHGNDGLSLCTVKNTLPDIVLLSCLTTLKSCGLDPAFLCLNKMSFAFEEALDTKHLAWYKAEILKDRPDTLRTAVSAWVDNGETPAGGRLLLFT